jgi:hypothetical protein
MADGLIAKGYAVTFKLAGGKTVKAPSGYAFLHDPSGKYWPACSGLVAPIGRKLGTAVDHAAGKEYFGHDPMAGELGVSPPKALSAWKRLGEVDEVLYTRRRPGGLKAYAGGLYYHPIEKGTAHAYRLGRLLRIELGSGCVWNWRGIVKP